MSAFRVRQHEDPLEREAREIANRRSRLEARRVRVLHPKTRQLGIDTLALQQQVEEKQERKRLEMERDLYYDDLSATFTKRLNEQDTIKQEYEKQKTHGLTAYRQAQIREKRRMANAERAAGDELTQVPTDFLKFGGEDPYIKDRERAQKLQQQDWLAQQIQDLQSREQSELDEQRSYDSMQRRINEVQHEQAASVQDARERRMQETLEYNRQLAAQKRTKQTLELQTNQNLDNLELANTLNSDLLNERGNDGVNMNFKGFSTGDRQRVLDIRQRQLEEKQARLAAEQQEEWEYAQQQESIRRARLLAERQQIEHRKTQRTALQDEHLKQAQEKTLRYDYLDNVVYTNPVQSSYFDQFGQSCR